MQYNISLSLEAEEDILIAYQWYEQQRKGLGDEFIVSLENSFSSIQSGPEVYSFRKKNIRGLFNTTFPIYSLIFY